MVGSSEVPDLDLELAVNLLVVAPLAELELGGVCLSEVFGLPAGRGAVFEVPQLSAICGCCGSEGKRGLRKATMNGDQMVQPV